MLDTQQLAFQQFLAVAIAQPDSFIIVDHPSEFVRQALWNKAIIARDSDAATHLAVLLMLPLAQGGRGYCTVDCWHGSQTEYTVRFFTDWLPDFVSYAYRDGDALEAIERFCRTVMEDARFAQGDQNDRALVSE